MALQEAGALPSEMQKFMDSATEGAVFVSFGSSLRFWFPPLLMLFLFLILLLPRSDQMPPEKIKMFMETFKQLKMKVFLLIIVDQVDTLQVIWKWDTEMPGLPDDILLR